MQEVANILTLSDEERQKVRDLLLPLKIAEVCRRAGVSAQVVHNVLRGTSNKIEVLAPVIETAKEMQKERAEMLEMQNRAKSLIEGL